MACSQIVHFSLHLVYGMHSVQCAVFLSQLYLNKVVKIDVFRNLY